MIEPREIHWLAGLLEGEGCFGQSSKGSRCKSYYRLPVIKLSMTDEDVVRKAHELLTRGHLPLHGRQVNVAIATRLTVGRKQVYQCAVGGRRAVAWMMTLYPLLGARRRARIGGVLDQWRAYVPAKTGRKLGKQPGRTWSSGLGAKRTPEQCARISEGKRASWARKKELAS